jgi:hypothetical protein
MLLLALTLLAAEPAPPAAPPPDDCILDADAIKGALDASKVAGYQVERGARSLVERAVVEGRGVSYRVGGCAHFAYSFTFELGGEPVWLREHARARLTAVPVVADERDGVELLLRALEALKADVRVDPNSPPALSLPLRCGDATCSLEVVAAKGAPNQLAVTYDFPL